MNDTIEVSIWNYIDDYNVGDIIYKQDGAYKVIKVNKTKETYTLEKVRDGNNV